MFSPESCLITYYLVIVLTGNFITVILGDFIHFNVATLGLINERLLLNPVRSSSPK